MVLAFRYGQDIAESSRKIACYSALVAPCRVLSEFTWLQAKIKIEIEKLCVYCWISLYSILTIRYGQDIAESSRKVACYSALVAPCRVLSEFTWFKAKIKTEIEKLRVYYWISLYSVLTFRYGWDIAESSRKVACYSALVAPCRVLTEFTWFKAKIKTEIEKLCIYNGISLYLVWAFRYGQDIAESSRKIARHPALVVSCRLLSVSTWFQAKIKTEIEKLRVYYWMSLYLVLTIRYGQDIAESSRKVACYSALVAPCRVLSEFTWLQAKMKIEIEKLCVYYWISWYSISTFRYGQDVAESSRKVACHPALIAPCRALTEFTWFQVKIKIEIEKLTVYYWISLYSISTFRYGQDIAESSRKVACHPAVVASYRVLIEFTWLQAKIKIEIEKLCVYYWISLYSISTFRYGQDIAESSRKVACHPALIAPCRALTEFTWFQVKIKIEIEKLTVYYWISLYSISTFRYGQDIAESSRKVACHPAVVASYRVLIEFTWLQAKIKIEIEKLCVYYWISLYSISTFRYGQDIAESSRKVACHPALIAPCRALTEFTWFQVKIKIEIEKLTVYYWISLYSISTFRYGQDIAESSRKVACHPAVVASYRVLIEFTWLQAKIKIEIEKLCVYYWMFLYLVFTFWYGQDIAESSRKVACHSALVAPCRVLTEFTWFKAKIKTEIEKTLRL